jgi:hypothetical protein
MLDVSAVIAAYEAGESVLSISRRLGVNREVVNLRLRKHGVRPRDRSEAALVRMANASARERAQMTASALEVRRGQTETRSLAEMRAARSGRNPYGKIRDGEIPLACLLSERGYYADMQRAEGPYNIDLAFWPVAVEVHRPTAHPFADPKMLRRTEHLVDAGRRVLYVWQVRAGRTYRRYPELTPEIADEVVAHLERAQRDPSSVGPYRVIRCTRQGFADASLHRNEVAFKPRPHDGEDSAR